MPERTFTTVITGANRGIGFELSAQYLAEGWQVYACSRQPDAARKLQALSANPALRLCQLDVTDWASVKGLAIRLASTPVDILINNAGLFGGDRQSFGNLDYDRWLQVLDVNTLGPYRVSTALADSVARSTHRTIVNLSSSMASIQDYSSGGGYIYRSSKIALNMVTVNLAHDLKPRGITVLAVDPGWVRTDMGGPNAELDPEQSATGIRAVLEQSSVATSERFVSWENKTHAW